MNKADSDRIHQLCSQIAEEKDHGRFAEMVKELNDLLNEEEEQLAGKITQKLASE